MWTDNSGQGYANEADQLAVAVYAADTDLFQMFENAAARNEGGTNLKMLGLLLWADGARVGNLYRQQRQGCRYQYLSGYGGGQLVDVS